MSRNNKISKFLSLVLRHKPETIGLELDREGWTDVKELLIRLRDHRMPLTMDELEEIVATNNKKRFKFNDNKTKIRASQGHSINVDLKLEPVEPPDVLYHGTATKNLDSIFKYGISKQKRQHVHLSADKQTARKVGQRHGNVVVITIDAKKMYEAGEKFFLSDNNVWLTDYVEPKYFGFIY